MVMGKEASRVSEADALSHVAGYATGNDFTARDLQLETGGQWMAGKTPDQFAPLGRYLVTADQIDPDNLKIELSVNGETRQSSNTSDFIFGEHLEVVLGRPEAGDAGPDRVKCGRPGPSESLLRGERALEVELPRHLGANVGRVVGDARGERGEPLDERGEEGTRFHGEAPPGAPSARRPRE
jgi:hypothetical protein